MLVARKSNGNINIIVEWNGNANSNKNSTHNTLSELKLQTHLLQAHCFQLVITGCQKLRSRCSLWLCRPPCTTPMSDFDQFNLTKNNSIAMSHKPYALKNLDWKRSRHIYLFSVNFFTVWHLVRRIFLLYDNILLFSNWNIQEIKVYD